MSFKEINILRQIGKLDEALQRAYQALASDPNNIWNKRAVAWVHYDYLKKFAKPESFEAFKENLIKIKELQLPEDEKLIFDKCAWQIGSLIFALLKTRKIIVFRQIDELFEIIKEGFHFPKPSESYSFLFKAFYSKFQFLSNFVAFADWWNFENFRPEDYLKEEFNGKKLMSIVEQAYIAYAKELLEGKPFEQKPFEQKQGIIKMTVITIEEFLENLNSSNHYKKQRVFDTEKIQSFLPKLDNVINKYPDYLYLPYFKAKLLLALGSNDENVLSAFLPFAKQKKNEFWVWELMAEIFSNNKDIQFACYCKALSLKTPEDFLVKLRHIFTEVLIEKKMYDEAKTEIQKIIATREKNEWKIPEQIVYWTEKEWYKNANAKKDNSDLYLNYCKQAEDLLFQDIPEEVVVVEFVNENKSILNFVKNKQKFGFFKYAGYVVKPQIGDILSVRFNGEGKDGYYNILSAKKVDSNIVSEVIKDFEGELKIILPQNIGFVKDIFIDPKFLKEKKLIGGQIIKGRAMLSFNKKKNEWGWKAIEIK